MALPLDDFLRPLHVDVPKLNSLARSFSTTFTRLAAESLDQFLPTPISESVLRPDGDDRGRYLAIDIGGTNLRVGFIELLGSANSSTPAADGGDTNVSRVERHLEKSWPIGELLKKNKAEDLFAWIGMCVAEVVQDGCDTWPGEFPDPTPMGVTFSFPMVQHTLADATLMGMGKGFALTKNLDLAKLLLSGYESSRTPTLPTIKIVAICNDAVATLVSFAYQMRSNPRRKAAMGLIVGTGSNATIPLAISKLHPSKRPKHIKILDDHEAAPNLKIAINTEWTINGAAAPLHDHNLITQWDKILDAEGEAPGFQPFEYMTAGRYLGELGRLIALDYFTNHLKIPKNTLPEKLRTRHGLPTTFLGFLKPHVTVQDISLSIRQLDEKLPPDITSDVNIPWAVPLNEKSSYDSVFRLLDKPGSGLIDKEVAYNCFTQSGLENEEILRVWKLASQAKKRHLNIEEFALAMHLINRKRKGEPIPAQLPPELIPPSARSAAFQWTAETASILYFIGKAVEKRAAGMTAAAILALLASADELPLFSVQPSAISLPNGSRVPILKPNSEVYELMVGYTGGCIVHFQDYLKDCQSFLDAIMQQEFGDTFAPRVVLTPCHDGGIIGAGVLAGTMQNGAHDT